LLGIDIYLEGNISYFNSDFVDDFFTISIELDEIKILLLVSINLRLEIPILNSKLMRKKEKIKFFSLGISGFYYSNSIKHLGNSVKDVIDFIKGKTLLNKELHSLVFNFNVFNTLKLKAISFQILVGQSFYVIKNSFYLFKMLQNYVLKYCIFSKCNNLFVNVGYLNYLNSNYIKKKIDLEKQSFYFLNNVDNFNFLNKIKNNNFIVYRGCFFDEGAKKSNLVFPNLTFFEDNLKYKNYIGLTLYTRKVVSNTVLNNKEFFYLLNIFKYQFFKNNIYIVINFKTLLKYFSKFFVNFVCYNFNNKSFFIKNEKLKFLIENKLFSSLIINFYKTDVYSRNSKNVSLASLEYLKMITTYIK
jgi:hypothetical protein